MKTVNPERTLLAFVARYRTQGAAADALGVSPQFLSQVLTRVRPISRGMLDRLGIKYVPVRGRKSA